MLSHTATGIEPASGSLKVIIKKLL
jgi:hypothetical protein